MMFSLIYLRSPMRLYNYIVDGFWYFTAFTNVIYHCDFLNFDTEEKQGKIAKETFSGEKGD